MTENGYKKLDTIVSSEIFMDAESLGKALGVPVEEKDGRRAAALNLKKSGETVEFVPPFADFSKFDQIVAVIRSEGQKIQPWLRIVLKTRTAGLTTNDNFFSGIGGRLAFPRWGEYLFPLENFVVYGMPAVVNPVEKMILSFNCDDAVVWISELRGERRERAQGPRLTDKGLISELKLDAGNPDEILRHFKSRRKPLDIYSELPEVSKEWKPDIADKICNNFILGYYVGDPIDWTINPNGYPEWIHAFNRTNWFMELLTAYRVTGNVKYVKKLDEIWLSWLRANPEPVGHNGGGNPAWETLSCAVQIYASWLYCWFNLLQDENFRDATRIEILKSFYAHAEHLRHYSGYKCNWFIVESRVLYVLGVLFPEFKNSLIWREEGAKRLAGEIETQILPDGADWELSPGYHMMACRGFLEPHEIAKLNDLRLPVIFEERLPKTFEYVAGITRPDGTLPSLNDSGGYKKGWGSGENYLKLGARLFDRKDLLESDEGPYAGKSRVFPDSGFHVLSSGKKEKALWSIFDCGESGACHRHEDALNVEFFAHGYPFIVDPGITGYLSDDWTTYYRTTYSHNTVIVNGKGQDASANAPELASESVRGKVECVFGAAADFARARFKHGYDKLPEGIVHTRALFFARGRYWVIFDEVTGAGAENMEARFQFVPLRMTLDKRARLFRTMRQNLPNMELIVVGPGKGLKMSIATGETSPVGGWVSDMEDLPAPQARIKVTGEKLRLVTVVCPFASGVNSGAKIKEIKNLPETMTGLQISAGAQCDKIYYSWQGADLEIDGVKINSPLAFLSQKTKFCIRDNNWIEL